jgi:hypothetical protein
VGARKAGLVNTLDAARQMIRYALEEEACWHRLHGIVEEERERLWPTDREGAKRGWTYSGPVSSWDPTADDERSLDPFAVARYKLGSEVL